MQFTKSEEIKENHGVGQNSENSTPPLVILVTRLLTFLKRRVFIPNRFTGINFFVDFDE
jgi:hypothetical protein